MSPSPSFIRTNTIFIWKYERKQVIYIWTLSMIFFERIYPKRTRNDLYSFFETHVNRNSRSAMMTSSRYETPKHLRCALMTSAKFWTGFTIWTSSICFSWVSRYIDISHGAQNYNSNKNALRHRATRDAIVDVITSKGLIKHKTNPKQNATCRHRRQR